MRFTARRLALVGSLVALLVSATPAAAITHGQLDGDEHPYVGQLFFYDPTYPDPRFTDPGGWFNCSGTLISPTIVVTAGHCTFPTGKNGAPTANGSGGTDTWFSVDAEPDYTGIAAAPFIPDDNAGRYAHYAATLPLHGWVRGTAYPHPDYDDAAFFLADAGVVILSEPIELEEYGELAGLNYLDQFTGRLKAHTLFEAVGYGLTRSLPHSDEGGDVRMNSQQVIINSRGVYGQHDKSSIVFSNNNGTPHRGGTCSGDSGGPFLRDGTNLIVAINSYGVPPNCTGGDGAYRVDQPDDVAWFASIWAQYGE
jgi:Trypsin